MYSYEQRLLAVALYVKLGKRPKAVIRQLGYPTKNSLKAWQLEMYRRSGLGWLPKLCMSVMGRNRAFVNRRNRPKAVIQPLFNPYPSGNINGIAKSTPATHYLTS